MVTLVIVTLLVPLYFWAGRIAARPHAAKTYRMHLKKRYSTEDRAAKEALFVLRNLTFLGFFLVLYNLIATGSVKAADSLRGNDKPLRKAVPEYANKALEQDQRDVEARTAKAEKELLHAYRELDMEAPDWLKSR